METIRSSTIINENEINMIKDWINPNESFNFELLYRASRDGDEVKTFHQLCDGKGPTIVFIKNSHNFRFGGFTTVPWSNSNPEYKPDDKAFIFSLDAKKNIKYFTKKELFIIIAVMDQHLAVLMIYTYAIYVAIKEIVIVKLDMIMMLLLKK